MSHPIDLVALDLDGTLLDEDLRYTERVAAALAAAQARGVHVTLATGRAVAAIRPLTQALQIQAPVIGYQGGIVVDPVTGDVLHRATMPDDVARAAIHQARVEDLDFSLFVNDTIYQRELRQSPEFYDHWFGLPLRFAPDLTVALDQGSATKFILTAEPEESLRIEARWRAHFGDRLHMVRSHRLFFEGTPQGVSKGVALAWVAERLGVPRARVMAIGDAENDRAMIEWAGLGVAMGSAPPDVQAVADWVAPPVHEDGVAVALERFVLR